MLDHSIKIFNLHSNNLKLELETNIFYFFGRISSIFEIKNFNEIVATSFTEKTIKFFNLKTYEILFIINEININDYSNTICFFNNFLLIGIINEIVLINLKNHSIISKFDLNNFSCYNLINIENFIFYSIGNLNQGNLIQFFIDDKNNFNKIIDFKNVFPSFILFIECLDNFLYLISNDFNKIQLFKINIINI